MLESWLLATAALLLFYSPLLFTRLLSSTKNCQLLILGYFAGGSFYIILPAFLPIVLGEQIINLTFSYDAYFGSEILDKIYIIIIIYSIFSLLGFFLGFGANRQHVQQVERVTYRENLNYRLVFFIFLLSFIVTSAVTIQGLSVGVAQTGERGHGLPTSLLLVLTNTVIASMALLMDAFKKNRYRLILLGSVFFLFFVQSILVGGSRRTVAFFLLFVITPVLLRLRLVGKVYLLVTIPIVAFSVIIFGLLRKGLHQYVSLSEVISELPNLAAELKNNIDLFLLNADFAIIFDAFVGVLKKVPAQVDYLYGDTFLKFFYFAVPRELWPGKPQTISVIVSDRIYNRDSDLVSYNPNLLGEMYFNGGYISVAIIAFLVGILLGSAFKYGHKLSDIKLSNIIIFGIISMSLFNLWRGYTFEVILNLTFVGIIFYVVKLLARLRISAKSRRHQDNGVIQMDKSM